MGDRRFGQPLRHEQSFGELFQSWSRLHDIRAGDIVEIINGPYKGQQAHVAQVGAGQWEGLVHCFWPEMPHTKHGNSPIHYTFLRIAEAVPEVGNADHE